MAGNKMEGIGGMDEGMEVPTIIRTVKKILEDYPDSGQILKELLQNAEDAKAKEVKFLLDETHYGKILGISPTSAAYPFLGPALYAYNDAKFSDKDWRGVRMLGESIKEKDPASVGKFGLGFKSVFHLTDLPSFFSGPGVGFLDPHQHLFESTSRAWKWTESNLPRGNKPRHLFHKKIYQHEVFSSMVDTEYKHTLFRFPLRVANDYSVLSKKAYPVSRVKKLLHSLAVEGYMNLIFMKNLEVIKIYHKKADEDSPKLLFKIKIGKSSLSDIREKRLLLRESIMQARWQAEPLLVSYSMDVEMIMNGKKEESKWFVTHCLDGGTRSTELKKMATDSDFGLLPWASAATTAPVDSKPMHGHVFSFLPLPLGEKTLTGLPVHVHGHFVLDHNRHNVKWPAVEANDLENTDQSCIWNQLLVCETLPKAYNELCLFMRTFMSPSSIVSLFPTLSAVEPYWKDCLKPLYQQFTHSPLFYSSVDGGSWLSADRCFLLQERGILKNTVLKVMQNISQCAIDMPGAVEKTAVHFGLPFQTLTLNLLRKFLRDEKSMQNLEEDQKQILLGHILSDNNYKDLNNIQLLRMIDGSFIEFGCGKGISNVYYHNGDEEISTVLPGMERLFVDKPFISEFHLKRMADSGFTQIKTLSPRIFSTLLHQVLQEAGKNISKNSMKAIWIYLGKHFRDSLESFEGLPLLPVETEVGQELLELKAGQPWLLTKHFTANLAVQQCLAALGAKLISSIEQYILDHPVVPNKYFCQDDKDIKRLLDCLQNPNLNTFSKLEVKAREEFRKYLSSIHASQMPTGKKAQDLLRNLPVFRSVNVNTATPLISVSDTMEKGHSRGTYYRFPFSLDVTILSLHPTDEQLANTCAISILSPGDIIVKYVLPKIGRLQEAFGDQVVEFILSNFYKLNENRSFVNQVTTFPIFKNQLGNRKRACEMFQNENDILHVLSTPESKPNRLYEQYLDPLCKFGLKGVDDVTLDDLWYFMAQVNKKQDYSYKKDMSVALVKLLGKKPEWFQSKVKKERLFSHLNEYPWIPVLKSSDHYPPNLHWKGSDVDFAKPNDVMLPSTGNIYSIGSVSFIADPDVVGLATEMEEMFKWSSSPNVDSVLCQLQHMKEMYEPSVKAHYTVALNHIYRNVSKSVHLSHEKSKLRDLIWHGNGFANVSNIFEEIPLDSMDPYMHKLPDDLDKSLCQFFRSCGVRRSGDVLDVISKIQNETKSGCLSEMQRTLIVRILEHLCSMKGVEKMRHKIVLPVETETENLLLKPIDKCTFHQNQWNQSFNRSNIDLPEDVYLVHSSVSEKVVKQLRVPPLVSQKLGAEGLDFEFEGFGQQEPLTQRIQNILKSYKDGLAVIKELVQNADDAGATEVKFLYDRRQNKDLVNMIFDQGMSECQGPALWAYNNAKFTETDFSNITKLGSGSKKEQNDKVGRFGLGFNSVYNLTDVPSFVSGEYLVIFDPHMTHLGNCLIRAGQPGIRVKFSKKKLRDYKDQFLPYEGVFDCAVISSTEQEYQYPATLFRLPLRTTCQAEKSRICGLCYDDNEITKLLQIFYEGANTLLLFTQSVQKVSLHLLEDGCDPEDIVEMFCTERHVEHTLKDLPSWLWGQIDNSTMLKAADRLIKDRKREKLVTTTLVKISLTETKDGKQFFHKAGIDATDKHWIISNTSGIGASFQRAKENANLIPVAGVAVQLLKENETYRAVPVNGKLFCFLPLPRETGLPVHVNGFFAVSTDRRRLEQGTSDDKSNEEKLWNKTLLQEVASDAYIEVLKAITSVCTPYTEYELIWPDCYKTENDYQCLLPEFFKQLITEENVGFFSDGSNWVPLLKSVFFSEEDFCDTKTKEAAIKVLLIMEPHKRVIKIPSHVLNSIKACGLEQHIKKNFYSKNVFFENFLSRIGDVSEQERNTLVMMALKDNTLKHLLKQEACIPVAPDGKLLRKPPELIHPQSTAAKLYDESDGRFPQSSSAGTENFTDPTVLTALQHLGMLRDFIRWPDIINRAETISRIEPEKGHHRFDTLMTMIRDNLNYSKHSKSTKFMSALKSVRFLPVKHTPEGAEQWYSDKNKIDFTSANEAYLSVFCEAVCFVVPVVDDNFSRHGFQKIMNMLMGNKVPNVHMLLNQHNYLVDLMNETCNLGIWKNFLAVYKLLNDFCKGNCNENKRVAQYFENSNICINGVLVPPHKCALHLQESCSPWLNKIPSELSKYCGDFLCTIGVRDSFQASDYIKALSEIKEEHDRLDEPLLLVSMRMLQNLTDCLIDSDMNIDELQKEYGVLFIPDSEGYLRNCANLCFGDEDTVGTLEEENLHFAHHSLSFQTGKTLNMLGIKSLQQHVVMNRSVGIPFGQTESLTNRIKRLLEGYPFDEGILKEMVQNADDAKATEIHFILDKRFHSSDSVFSEGWKHLQGPSLLIYNNKPFTKNDLEGIKNLGVGSKASDPTKTGQYGVGFNCVYHITDTPMFLTNIAGKEEVLIVFDPNLTNVDATEGAPGKKYIDTLTLRAKFPDVFSPFQIEGHPFTAEEGTMFRLPLRTNKQASTSKINDQHVTPTSIKQLFTFFKKEMFSIPLFLNHIETIVLAEVDANTGGILSEYRIDCKYQESDMEVHHNYVNDTFADGYALQSHQIKISDISRQEICATVHMEDSEGKKESWLVVHSFGLKDPSCLRDTKVMAALDAGDLGLLPKGGVAALLSPLPDQAVATERLLYCLLPLPIKTVLPVHVNGHFALDHESRRSLWRDSKENFRKEWNLLLMEQVVAPSYVTLMMEYKNIFFSFDSLPYMNKGDTVEGIGLSEKDIEMRINGFNKLFPEIPEEDITRRLSTSVYQIIDHEKHHLLPGIWKIKTGGLKLLTWFSTAKEGKKVAVYKNQTVYSECAPKKDLSLEEILIDCGYSFFLIETRILKNFKICKINLLQCNPAHVLDFFKNHTRNNCLVCSVQPVSDTCLSEPSRIVTLLRYCSQDIDFVQDRLHGIPLLVTCDNKLRNFSNEERVYHTRFSDLFQSKSQCFLHKTLIDAINWEMQGQNPVVQFFDMEGLQKMLKNCMCADLCSGQTTLLWSQTPVQSTDIAKDQITVEWLTLFWEFLQECCQEVVTESKKALASVFKVLVEPIKHWTLLPGVYGKDKFLVQLGKPELLIDLTRKSSLVIPLTRALAKLKIPHLDLQIVNKRESNETVFLCETKDLSAISAHVENPEAVFTALCYWAVANNIDFAKCDLDSDDRRELVNYIAKHIHIMKQIQFSEIIRKIPLFQAINDKFVSMDRRCALITKKMPQNGLAIISQDQNVTFFAPTCQHKPVMEQLKCEIPKTYEIYTKYILPSFHKLQVADAWKHINFLVRKWYTSDTKKKKYSTVWETLRCQNFIPVAEGEFASASIYYDPDEPVFKGMLTEDKLPPTPPNNLCFNEVRWLKFLRDMGLTKSLTANMLVQFAQQIATDAEHCQTRASFEKLSQQAEELLHNIFYKHAFSESLLKQIQNINFIPLHNAKEQLRKLMPQLLRKSQFTFTSVLNGVIYSAETEDLVWTKCKLVPKWVEPETWSCPGENEINPHAHKEALVKALKLQVASVPVELVVSNIQNVCFFIHEQIEHDGQVCCDREMLMKTMNSAYNFLAKETKRTEKSEIMKLANCPFVFVQNGALLVKPDQIVQELPTDQQIVPYLYRLPLELGPYYNLFEELGATRHATVKQYQAILCNLHEKCKDKELHANEKQTAVKALFALMCLFKNNKGERSSVPLYGLSASGKLRNIKDMCYHDSTIFKGRVDQLREEIISPFTDMAEVSQISSNPEWKEIGDRGDLIFSIFPSDKRPSKLSEKITESIITDSQVAWQHDSSEGIHFRNHIQSQQFLHALRRLLNANEQLNEERVDAYIELIQTMKIKTVSSLQTQLFFEGHLISGSEKKQSCFIGTRKSPPEICIDSGNAKHLDSTLSHLLNEQLFNSVLKENELTAILQGDLDDLEDILDGFKVKTGVADEYFRTLPKCGEFVPVEDQHLLCQDLGKFSKDDYVGYEVRKGNNCSVNTDVTYIYGRVVSDETPEETSIMRKQYKVDLGNEQIRNICAVDLYRFHRKSELFCGPLVVTANLDSKQTDTDPKTAASDDRPQSLDEAKREVTETLEAAWELGDEEERKKVLRRLVLRWHPDKNLDQIELSTEVFKFIELEMKRIQKETDRATRTRTFNSKDDFDDFFSNLDAWARRQRAQRQHFHERHYRGFSDWDDSRGSRPPPSRPRKNPQPAEARHWLCQARHDLEAAASDARTAVYEGLPNTSSYEWACFKCHQAALKALRGCQYAVDADSLRHTYNLSDNCRGLDEPSLTRLAAELEAVVGAFDAMLFPDRLRGGVIPHDRYKQRDYEQARRLAEDILDRCQNFVQLRDDIHV